MKDGYKCKCGKYNKYPMYYYAHYDLPMQHTCECGRIYNLLCGVANLMEDIK